MDPSLNFPIYAVFIGASMGIASIVFVQRILRTFAITWIVIALECVLFSAILCIFSSNLFWNGSKTLSHIAVILLLLGYFILLALSLLLPKRLKENKTARRILSSVSENLGEKFDDMQRD